MNWHIFPLRHLLSLASITNAALGDVMQNAQLRGKVRERFPNFSEHLLNAENYVPCQCSLTNLHNSVKDITFSYRRKQDSKKIDDPIFKNEQRILIDFSAKKLYKRPMST